MESLITITNYLKMGGKLEKLNLNKTRVISFDEDRFKRIISFADNGDINDGIKSIYVTFEDKTVKLYSTNWIETKIDLTLPIQYIENITCVNQCGKTEPSSNKPKDRICLNCGSSIVCAKCGDTGRCKPQSLSEPDGVICNCKLK